MINLGKKICQTYFCINSLPTYILSHYLTNDAIYNYSHNLLEITQNYMIGTIKVTEHMNHSFSKLNDQFRKRICQA